MEFNTKILGESLICSISSRDTVLLEESHFDNLIDIIKNEKEHYIRIKEFINVSGGKAVVDFIRDLKQGKDDENLKEFVSHNLDFENK